jgi:hypothetical protein
MWNPSPALLAAVVVLSACSSTTEEAGADSDLAGPGAAGSGGGALCATPPCAPGATAPPVPTDGVKNGEESDVDCGGPSGPKCADDKQCHDGVDCASGVCTGGACQPPSGTDGVKNGDETDLDCGGTTTGAPRCAADKACTAHADCASGGCTYEKKCAEVRSCTSHFGGDTCGRGEMGSGQEKHESCCRSLPVPSFTDPGEPGKTVYLDKYEVTAGRVRVFVEELTAQYGKPDVKRWISENKPRGWQDGWSQYLASDTDAAQTALGNVGTNYAFGSALYVYVHGHNCFQGAGSYGFPTYWYPPAVMQTQNGGLPRVATQEQLDVKAMTCIPNAMLAAFCAWDGGQLATAEVLQSVTANGSRLPPLGATNVSGDSGATSSVYYFPAFGAGASHEGVSRIAAPGRVGADATAIGGGEPWMDLRGNLNEVARSGGGFALLYQGIGYSSARALNNPSAIPQPYYKAAYSGGRCMRFR